MLTIIILFTFYMNEIIKIIDVKKKFGYYCTYFVLDYFDYYHIEKDDQFRIYENIFFKRYVKKNKFNIFSFIENNVSFCVNDEFCKIFYVNFCKKNILEKQEMCGICLSEFDDNMFSYCGLHFICTECNKEYNFNECINKCEKNKLTHYTKQ